ncbi:hypothetical protein B0H16DRAFT_1788098 [Mycena metata]|uniref:Uncharacterized protein n=1 Tax=Mycena metata TaxID=1033252 RepID=A0AAD7MLK4_9AGAR|nr:hypothetical protein B0H16DRAFT_1788098 [Mycena metata]
MSKFCPRSSLPLSQNICIQSATGQSSQLFPKQKQYSQIGHTAVSGFLSMDSISPDARTYLDDFLRPNHISKTVNTITKQQTITAKVNAGPNPSGGITPKWIVECEPGHEFKNKDDYYEELNFSYMNTDLHPVAFVTRNQTMLWLSNGSLKSKGIGIIVLTSLITYVYETEVPPTDRALPPPPGNPLALAIGVLPDTAEPRFLKQILNRVTKSPKVQREGPLAADIKTLPLYEFTSRGWDATRNEWRMPIYPSLSHCLRQAVKNSTLRTWNLKVVGLEPDTAIKGKQRDPGQIVRPMDKDKDVNTTVEESKAALPFVGNSDKVDILVHNEFGKLWLDLDGKVIVRQEQQGNPFAAVLKCGVQTKEPIGTASSPQNKRLSTSALFFILGGLLKVARQITSHKPPRWKAEH